MQGLSFFSVPGMALFLWGVSPLWALMVGTTSLRQLRYREVRWGGSRRQNSERWVTYFRMARCKGQLDELERWPRRRLRCFRIKQCKRLRRWWTSCGGWGFPKAGPGWRLRQKGGGVCPALRPFVKP